MKSFDRLVVPVADSSAARHGINFAIEPAKREGAAVGVCSAILVAIDESSASLAALDCAIEHAGRIAATLALLHVCAERRVELSAQALGSGSRDAQRRALTEAEDTFNDAADRARAGATIVSVARRHASARIAIGTYGRGEPGRLLFGSVAHEVDRTARVPVYVVHHQRSAASITPSPEHPYARPSKHQPSADRHEIR